MFRPTICTEHRQAVLRGMNKMFALAGKNPSEQYTVLPNNAFSLELPLEHHTSVGSYMHTSTIIEALKEWRQIEVGNPFPILCVDLPLYHTYSDGSAGFVLGICSVGNAFVVTTYRNDDTVSEEDMLASLSLTVLHELGHDMDICPPDREGAIVDKRGSHCARKTCAMYPSDTPELIARWKKGKPLCKECLHDLNIEILPPHANSLADIE